MSRKKTNNKQQNGNLELKTILPETENQRKVFNAFDEEQQIVLHGVAGTGKSFISLYLTLNEILKYHSRKNQVIIVRSAVPSRDMGFLPGNEKEKSQIYEQPYKDICKELFGRSDAYEILKQKFIVDFTTTSFNRGITFRDCFVIVDEIQNMGDSELNTIMTRIGENCQILLCGDYRQSDLTKEKSGIDKFLKTAKIMPSFEFVSFRESDILRSEFVKEYIIARSMIENGKQLPRIEEEEDSGRKGNVRSLRFRKSGEDSLSTCL